MPNSHIQVCNALKLLQFPIAFCFAVENVWITALMISFDNLDIVDSFIWIIPNIISILLRPYITQLILSQKAHSRGLQLSVINFMMIISVIGCLLVSVSAYMFNSLAIKILVCTIGWTLMDLGFQMVNFYAQKYQENILKGLQQSQQNQALGDSSQWQMYGTISGYMLSIAICMLASQKSVKKFQKKSAIVYLISGFIALCFMLNFHYRTSSVRAPLTKQIKSYRPVVCADPGFYLPGYYQFTMANKEDKLYLYYHFTILYIVDTLLIYTTMWIVYAYQQQGFKPGSSYNSGMLYGSLFLMLYSLFYYLQFDFGINQKQSIEHILQIGMLIVCVFAAGCYFTLDKYLIGVLAILIGVLHSFYQNKFEEAQKKKNPVFQVCLEFVDRIEKIFILCPMPFITMIMLKRDDVEDCLLWVGGVGLTAIAYGCLMKYASEKYLNKKAKRTNKIE